MKYNKEYKRSSFEPSIDSNNATSGRSSHYSKELYKKKEPRKKPYSVLQRVEPRNRKRVENFNNDCVFLIEDCLQHGMDEACMMAEEEDCWSARILEEACEEGVDAACEQLYKKDATTKAPQLQAIGPGVGNNLLIAEDIRPNTAQLQAIGPGVGNNLITEVRGSSNGPVSVSGYATVSEGITQGVGRPAQLEEMPTTSNNFLACPIPSHEGFIQEYASPGGEYSFFEIQGRTPGVLGGYDSSAGRQRVFPKQSMLEESYLLTVDNFNQKATTGISQEQYVKQNPVIDLKTTVGGKKFNIKLAQLYRPKLGEWDVLGFKLLTGRYPGKPQEFGYIQWFKDDFNCGISDVYQFRLGNRDISQEYLDKLPKDSCPPCPDIPLANTSDDDKWWTDYNQLMWKDDEHYNSWKKKLDSKDRIRGDLKDLPGPGKNTWDWNLIDSGRRTDHPFYNRKYPDEDPNGGFRDFKAGNINILYHSKQAYQELTYEILNGKLKNANKKKIRRQWLIKLMGFISKAFLDVFQSAARRLESILEKLMIETNGKINEDELKHIVAEYERVIDNHIVVMVDNLTLLDYVWDSAQLDGAHDHDPDSFYSILKNEIGTWTKETVSDYRSRSASYRVKNKGGGNFTLVNNEDDYDTEGEAEELEDDVPATAVGSATGHLTTGQLALADVIREVARVEGLTDIEYEVLAGRFPPFNRQLVELAELDPRQRPVAAMGAMAMRNQVSMMKTRVLNELQGGVGIESEGSADDHACSDALKACQDGVQPACVYYTDNCVGVGTAVLEGAGRVNDPVGGGDPAACNEAENACDTARRRGTQGTAACSYYKTHCEAAAEAYRSQKAGGAQLGSGVSSSGAGPEAIGLPSKQNMDRFKRISKLLITALIKDEPLPPEIIQMYNASKGGHEPTFEQGLKKFNEKNKEEFGENAPQLDASTSPMSKYIAAAATVANHPNFESQMQGIKMLMAYISLHMDGESDWIIETFGELLNSKYKDTRPIIFAAQFIKKLNNVIKQSEGVSNTNVADTVAAAGRAAERVAELETQLAGRRERVTELQTQLAARPTRSELVSLEAELETARGNITTLEEAVQTLTAARDAALTTQDDEAAAALVELASQSGETVSLKMKQIEDLGEEIIALKAELEEEKAKTNVPADVEELIKEEKEECKKEVNIYKAKIFEEVKKVNKERDKDIESKDKTIKYIAIGAGVVIVLLILFLLMK